VVALLGKLDRQPRQVVVEVLIVEAAAKADKGLDAKELTGPADKVLAGLKALSAKGRGSFKRVRLRGLEHRPASAVVRASTPYAVGAVRAGRGGGVSHTISYRDLGTSVTVTPRVTAGDAIVVDLRLEDSGGNPREGVVIDDSDKQAPVRAPKFTT